LISADYTGLYGKRQNSGRKELVNDDFSTSPDNLAAMALFE
jgi:hypothetical protein